MHRPWLSIFSSLTEIDERFDHDQDFSARCCEVALELYQTIKPEVAALRQVPSDCMSLTLWDLCNCASWLMDTIESCPDCTETQCVREACELYKLTKAFLRYNASAQVAARKLLLLVTYAEQGVGAGTAGRAS
jgi:hypothetical protein